MLSTRRLLSIFIAFIVVVQLTVVYLNTSTLPMITHTDAAASSMTTSWQRNFVSDHANNFNSQPKSTNSNNNGAIRKDNRSNISSFWWPSPASSGGFLSAIHRTQHPANCTSPRTKYLVLRSLRNNDGDNRGLSAWASVSMHHFLHAFLDGDDASLGRRILINDEKIWPMARGCRHGNKLETRDCYFVPLSNCNIHHADTIITNDEDNTNNKNDGKTTSSSSHNNVAILKDAKEEYDRSVRTVYTSDTAKYARMVKDIYSWTGLNGKDYPKIELVAAFLAYYLQPQPWLRNEIDKRLQRSLPHDLDPDKTIGVPIRRSDKCHGHTVEGSAKGELDCPSLDSYLIEVKRFIDFDPYINSIIVTSEDASATMEFITMIQRELPNLRIITNRDDVQQGTGSAAKLESYKQVENEDVIASALTSLHMHLRARYFVITTKSSWTSTIAILARVYGFARNILVVDIGPTTHAFSWLAKLGGSGKT
eukprot:scaffold4079_cov44-Cyclotella_meneghiniana.AAC.5